MTLQDVINQINAECPAFKKTGFLTDIAEINTPVADTPAVFAFWGNDSPSQIDGAGALVNQVLTTEISLLIFSKVPDSSSDTLQSVRADLFSALIGFEVGDSRLSFSGGSVESINGGVIQWRDNYQFTRYLRFTR